MSARRLFDGRTLFCGGLVVFFDTELPGGAEGAGEDVFGGFGENDVGGSHAAPAAVNGEKDIGLVLKEGLLEFRGQHEVAVSLVLRSEGGEDVAADAEVCGSHVRALFGPFEAERDATEIVWRHEESMG
jgi:hypothetical protein